MNANQTKAGEGRKTPITLESFKGLGQMQVHAKLLKTSKLAKTQEVYITANDSYIIAAAANGWKDGSFLERGTVLLQKYMEVA